MTERLSYAIQSADLHQNQIKSRAREHPTFRKRCVAFAQWLHRVDMRMRLGILHDAAAQERMHAREAAEIAVKKKKAEAPTVRTEAEQKAYDAEVAQEKDKASEKVKATSPKIRPLSESRAIELGANFISESFIFGVAAGLLIWDSWRSRRKENSRREDVADRLEALEAAEAQGHQERESLRAEILRLRAKYEPESREQDAASEKASAPAAAANPPEVSTKDVKNQKEQDPNLTKEEEKTLSTVT